MTREGGERRAEKERKTRESLMVYRSLICERAKGEGKGENESRKRKDRGMR